MKLDQRQGDVGFVQSAIPKDAKRIALRPLALGEVTGHSHQVAIEDRHGVEMFEIEGSTFLRVTAEGGVSIVHEEHGPITLPVGWEGEIRIAREYDEEIDFRQVMD
jgi:hypothetical protein